MKEKDEVEYNGHWIEVTTRESNGLFLSDARITGRGPGSPGRQWATLDLKDEPTFVDRESAHNYGLRQAKNFVDKLNVPTPDAE